MNCGADVKLEDIRNKRAGAECSCPSCGSIGKVKYASSMNGWSFACGIIPDIYKDGRLSLRYFDINVTYENVNGKYLNPTYSTKEVLREIFNDDGSFECYDRVYGDNDFVKCNLRNDTYMVNYMTNKPCGCHINPDSSNIRMYTRNMKKYTKGTKLQYIDFNKIFKDKKLKNRYMMWNIIGVCLETPGWRMALECLPKLGLTNLAFELANSNSCHIEPKENTLKNILKINKEKYNELVKLKSKANMDMLYRFQIETENPNLIKSDDDWKVYMKYIDGQWNKKDFFKLFKFSLYKYEKYVLSIGGVIDFGYYTSYLNMCNELGLDMKSTFVAFPKDLHKAHDAVADMYNEMQFDLKLKKYADKANQFSSQYSNVVSFAKEKYLYEDNNYTIVVPESTKDIGYEGYKLRHCVAQYTEKAVNGEITILFIREKNALDVPFYTMSIVNNMIDECKGYRNMPRKPEVQMFLENFAKKKHLTINKQEHFAAVM